MDSGGVTEAEISDRPLSVKGVSMGQTAPARPGSGNVPQMGGMAPARGRNAALDAPATVPDNESVDPHTRSGSFGGQMPTVAHRMSRHSVQQLELINRSRSIMKFGRLSSKKLLKEKAKLAARAASESNMKSKFAHAQSQINFRFRFTVAGDGMVFIPEYQGGGIYERLQIAYLIFDVPDSCELALKISITMLGVISVTCITYIFEGLEMLHKYSDECSRCQPYNPLNSTSVAIRQSHEQYCIEKNCEPGVQKVFEVIEIIAVTIFTIEYTIRIMSCWTFPSLTEQRIRKRIENPQWEFTVLKVPRRILYWFCQPLNLVDFIAFFPQLLSYHYDSMPNSTAIRVLRLFRVARVIRVMKLSETMVDFSDGLVMFLNVIRRSSFAFNIMLCYITIFMIITAALIFGFEQGEWDYATGYYHVQSDLAITRFDYTPSDFRSIPDTFWWILTSITTVGYGEMYPITRTGRLVGVFVMVGGVLMLALPIAVIGGNFTEEYAKKHKVFEERKARRKYFASLLVDAVHQLDIKVKQEAYDKWWAFVREQRQIDHIHNLPIREKELDDILDAAIKAARSAITSEVVALVKSSKGEIK